MKQEKLISIICPVFNASSYLKRAVFSIINQTHKKWELILIDDGSTDNSPELCDEFARKDIRIKVIHKNNEGPMIARKIGIEKANGNYIVFLDSDDELTSNAIFELYKVVNGYDAVIYNAAVLSNTNVDKKTIARVKETKSIDRSNIENTLFGDQMFGYLWLYCIKKDIVIEALKENNQFISIRYTEDLFFLTICAKHFKNILLLKEDLYLYRINNSSITNNLTYKDRKNRVLVFNSIYGHDSVMISDSVCNTIAWAIVSYFRDTLTCEKNESRKVFKEIKQSGLFKTIKTKKMDSRFLNIFIFFVKANFYVLTKLLFKFQKRY